MGRFGIAGAIAFVVASVSGCGESPTQPISTLRASPSATELERTAAMEAPGLQTALILFTSERDGNSEIYVVNADGSSPRRLTDHPAADGNGSWSPDGRRVAFSSNRDGNFDIWVMNADGSSLRNLTADEIPHSYYEPDWSPNGRQIVFTGQRPDQPYPGTDIYLVDADGSGLTNLTQSAYEDYHPDWSPNGRLIAFSTFRAQATSADIFVMGADGSDPRNLTNNPSGSSPSNFDPAWSPDGRRIAFSRGGILHVMNSDGSGSRSLQVTGAHPTWRRDKRWIAFSDRVSGVSDIFAVAVDGSSPPVNLTSHPASDFSPEWRRRSGP